MGLCYFCEKEQRVSYLSYYCETCRKLKNLGNCYGFDRVYTIINKCCIRDPNQLENKIKNHKKSVENNTKKDEDEATEKGDDIKDYDNPNKIAEDENKEYFLRRKSNNKKSKSKSQYDLKT